MNFGAYIELGSLLHHDLSVELFAPTKDRKSRTCDIWNHQNEDKEDMGTH